MKTHFQKFFILFSSASMLVTIYFTYLEYDLSKTEAEKYNDPLLQYSFDDDKNAFVVSAGDDIEIKQVTWIMPSAVGNVSLRINKHPRVLTLQDIITQLYDDSIYLLSGLSSLEYTDFVKCRILSDDYKNGIPLIAEITFRMRGIPNENTTRSLVYAQWLTSENPFMEVFEENASKEQEERFIAQGKRELERIFSSTRESLLAAASFKAGNDCHFENIS